MWSLKSLNCLKRNDKKPLAWRWPLIALTDWGKCEITFVGVEKVKGELITGLQNKTGIIKVFITVKEGK